MPYVAGQSSSDQASSREHGWRNVLPYHCRGPTTALCKMLACLQASEAKAAAANALYHRQGLVGLLASAQALQLCTMLNPSDSWAHVQKQQGTNAAAGSQAELPNGHPPPVDTYAQPLQMSAYPESHQMPPGAALLHHLCSGGPVAAVSTH